MICVQILFLSLICGHLPLFQCNPKCNHAWQRRFKVPQFIKNIYTRDPTHNISSYTFFPPVLSRLLNSTRSQVGIDTNSKVRDQLTDAPNFNIERSGDTGNTNVKEDAFILRNNEEKNENVTNQDAYNMTGFKDLALALSRRMTLARQATIEDYPYVVSIQNGGQQWCSGALISTRIVLTTASCVWNSEIPSTDLKIRAGSRYSDHGGSLVGIQDIVKHPDWSLQRAPDFDIALVMMDQPLKFSDGLHSVELPKEATMPPFNDTWVTSWGAERADGEYRQSSVLQVYHALLVKRDDCSKAIAHTGVKLTDNFICLAQTGGKGPCTRDTGAPAVSDGVLWGVASWGIRESCGTQESPAVFAYLASAANLGFIKRSSQQLMGRLGFDLA